MADTVKQRSRCVGQHLQPGTPVSVIGDSANERAYYWVLSHSLFLTLSIYRFVFERFRHFELLRGLILLLRKLTIITLIYFSCWSAAFIRSCLPLSHLDPHGLGLLLSRYFGSACHTCAWVDIVLHLHLMLALFSLYRLPLLLLVGTSFLLYRVLYIGDLLCFEPHWLHEPRTRRFLHLGLGLILPV